MTRIRAGDLRGKGKGRLTPQERRALIDEAAASVFAERGYEGATMGDIARAAGVVASVLYDHYPSKRSLYTDLLEQRSRDLMERSIRAAEDSDHRAALGRQIDDFFRIIEADPFLWRTLFRDPPADPEIAVAHERVQSMAGSAIIVALGTGVEMTASTIAAEMVRSSLTGLAAWWWKNPELPRERLVNTATAVIWDGLGSLTQATFRVQG
jgi:AcrR family transcriptional regulator